MKLSDKIKETIKKILLIILIILELLIILALLKLLVIITLLEKLVVILVLQLITLLGLIITYQAAAIISHFT